MNKKLRFRKNKKFIILQIADSQERVKPSPDTIRMIEAGLDKIKPDLAIFTGDQIKGYAIPFVLGKKKSKENIKKCLDAQIKPLLKRNIPFVATFGNHDAQAGLDEKEQFEIYKSYENSYNKDNDETLSGEGTFNLPIYSSDGDDKIPFNLYIINSYGLTDKIGHYTSVTKEQIEWYQNKRDELKKINGGEYIPSLLFQHIPVPEISNLIKKTSKKTKGAVEGYGPFKGDYYVVNDDVCFDNKLFGETPGSPRENTNEFEAVNEKGDVLGMYFGHDHRNNFAGKYKGMDLGYCPSCGFHVYGPGMERAFRVFEIDEKNPKDYKTYTISYEELCGKPIQKLTNHFYHIAPANLIDVKNICIKVLGTAAVIALMAILKIKLL